MFINIEVERLRRYMTKAEMSNRLAVIIAFSLNELLSIFLSCTTVLYRLI